MGRVLLSGRLGENRQDDIKKTEYNHIAVSLYSLEFLIKMVMTIFIPIKDNGTDKRCELRLQIIFQACGKQEIRG